MQLIALGTDGVTLEILLDQYHGAGTCLDMAVQRKLLVVENGRARCRHDLIRASLVHALPPVLARRLHGRLLGLLEGGVAHSPDIAKLAYHSLGAGDTEKGFVYSLQAARAAARVGAHRQAAFHYSNALGPAAPVPDETLNDALLEAAKEHCLINAFDQASEFAGRRVGLCDSEIEKGKARAWLAYFHSRHNDLSAVRREAIPAIQALCTGSPSEELALALAAIAWVDLVEGQWKDAIVLADEAVAIARATNAPSVEVHAATTGGAARSVLGDPRGRIEVAAAVDLGIESGAEEFASRAMNNLGLIALEDGFLDEARGQFDRLIEYTIGHQLDAWYIAALATRSWINVLAGLWGEADLDLERVLGQRTCIQTEVEALVIAAILRTRRGDPGSTEAIETVLGRIEGTTDLGSLIMGCALALEGAWIGIFPLDSAAEMYASLVTSPALVEFKSGRSTLAFWARRLDLDPPDGRIPGPSGLEWAGAADDAAVSWERKGFPMHAAVTQAMVPGADLAAAFSDLASLGAEGVLRGLRRELQRRGVKSIPRGDRPSTRSNPFGLTERQAEVLALMATGLSNSAIADELFISEKTASHHVSAVLSKLNASSRLQAVATAVANGWTGPDLGSRTR
jgi:DNA-binding CsgD family transcriptional regulator/tetratricopeptide (TPR) repeat protein